MTKDCLDGDSGLHGAFSISPTRFTVPTSRFRHNAGTVGRQRPWKSHPWVASTMDPALGRGPARSLSCPHKHHYHYHTPSVEGQFDNALEEDPVLPPARARFASVPPPPRSGNNSLRHDRSQPTWLRLRLAPKENSTLPQHLVPSHTMNRPTPVRTVTTTHVQQPPPPPLIHSTVVVRAISPPSPWTHTPPLPPPTGARLPLSPRPVPKLVPKLVPTSHYHHLSHPSLKIIPDYRMDPAMRLPIAQTVPSDWEHQTSPVVTLAVRDILLGRGGGTNQHAGNLWYRALLQHYRLAYTQAPKFDKAQLARNLTNYIRLCGGRFLQKGTLAQPPGAVSVHRHGNGGDCYYEVGDVRARLKVTQVLREEPPHTRKRRCTRTEEETTNAPLTAAAMFEQHQQQLSAQKR